MDIKQLSQLGPVARGIFEALLMRRPAEINTGTALREISVSVLTVDDMDEIANSGQLPRWSEFMNTLVESGHITVVMADESYIVLHRELDAEILTRMYCTFVKEQASKETHITQMRVIQPCHGGEYTVAKGGKVFRRFDDNFSLAKLLFGQLVQNSQPGPKAVSLLG